MDERRKFVAAYLSDLYDMTELCRSAGVSRPTGYLWVRRYLAEGEAGLCERSRAPHRCPHRTPKELEAALLAARQQHPRWGPRKLLALLKRQQPRRPWPSRSAVADLLRREGLVKVRRRRPHPAVSDGQPARTPSAPNVLWTIDFKGEFRTGDGRYCYPLTVADLYSRYLLACLGMLAPLGASVIACTTALFRAYGLPDGIHSDGGTPFAGPGLRHLSAVSLFWLRLGIHLERSRPACPQDNASHERMHQTLKADTARPPAANLPAQQLRFDAFRSEFNELRPHESLGDRPPCEFHRPSNRPFPARLPPVEYPGYFELRRVHHTGEIKWRNRALFLSSVLAGELVGLEEIEEGLWSVYFSSYLLARFDEHVGRLIPLPV
jgi:transposase InsO family protein